MEVYDGSSPAIAGAYINSGVFHIFTNSLKDLSVFHNTWQIMKDYGICRNMGFDEVEKLNTYIRQKNRLRELTAEIDELKQAMAGTKL
jgi:hypothetical protein